MNFYEKVKVTNAMFKNKLALILLDYALSFYRKQSSILIQNIPKEELWVSGIETEEKILDQSQRIIGKRLSNTSQKNKYKNKSK